MGFTITRGKIVAIGMLPDPARLRRLDRAVLDDLRVWALRDNATPDMGDATGAERNPGKCEEGRSQPLVLSSDLEIRIDKVLRASVASLDFS